MGKSTKSNSSEKSFHTVCPSVKTTVDFSSMFILVNLIHLEKKKRTGKQNNCLLSSPLALLWMPPPRAVSVGAEDSLPSVVNDDADAVCPQSAHRETLDSEWPCWHHLTGTVSAHSCGPRDC